MCCDVTGSLLQWVVGKGSEMVMILLSLNDKDPVMRGEERASRLKGQRLVQRLLSRKELGVQGAERRPV